MTPPKVDRGDYMTAMHAFGYKKCRCGRLKVRDVEAICKECFAKLPKPMQRGLKGKLLYPAVYHPACKFLTIW
jgi:hypothetical protein